MSPNLLRLTVFAVAVWLSLHHQVSAASGPNNIVSCGTSILASNFPNRAFCILHKQRNAFIAKADIFNVISIYDRSRKELYRLTGHVTRIKQILQMGDLPYLVSYSDDNKVIVWSLEQKSIHSQFFDHDTEILSMAYIPSKKLMASSDVSKQVHFWNPYTGELVHTLQEPTKIHAIAFIEKSNEVGFGTLNYLRVYSLDNYVYKLSYTLYLPSLGLVDSLIYVPGKNHVIAASSNSSFLFSINVTSTKQVYKRPAQKMEINAMGVQPQSLLFFSQERQGINGTLKENFVSFITINPESVMTLLASDVMAEKGVEIGFKVHTKFTSYSEDDQTSLGALAVTEEKPALVLLLRNSLFLYDYSLGVIDNSNGGCLVQCSPGFFAKDNNCFGCHSSCKVCTDENVGSCSECWDDTFLFKNSCLSSCPEGMFPDRRRRMCSKTAVEPNRGGEYTILRGSNRKGSESGRIKGKALDDEIIKKESDVDEVSENESSLVLLITLPLLGVLILAGALLFCFFKMQTLKKSKEDEQPLRENSEPDSGKPVAAPKKQSRRRPKTKPKTDLNVIKEAKIEDSHGADEGKTQAAKEAQEPKTQL